MTPAHPLPDREPLQRVICPLCGVIAAIPPTQLYYYALTHPRFCRQRIADHQGAAAADPNREESDDAF